MTAEEKAEATRHVILRMEAALGENSDDMAAHFHEDFRWMGNRGCGTKPDLRSFRENWQLPLRASPSVTTNRTLHLRRRLGVVLGHIEATHSGEFMDFRDRQAGDDPLYGLESRGRADQG